jgi:hypothetical protein
MMRVLVSILSSVFLAGCASGERISVGHHGQPHVAKGTTIVALAVIPSGATPPCRAVVSRETAYVDRNKSALWEVVDVCNEQEQEIELKFVDGNLSPYLDLRKNKGKVKHGQPDFLDVFVTKGASSGQYAKYEIWLGGQKIADPKIQVP